MDKKDLEKDLEKKGEGKEGKDKDLVYKRKVCEKDLLVIKRAKRSEYRVGYKAGRIYTYEDYLNWSEGERVELIDGKIYYMATPTKRHQELLRRLSTRFDLYLHSKVCDIYFAPFDVRIDLDLGGDSVVQPDLVVVCDDELLNEAGLAGSPDLVIEILSKSTARRDRVIKYNKYLDVGVKEYWLVDPEKEEVSVNLLKSDRYITRTYVKGDIIKVNILDDLSINVTDLFDGYKGDEVKEIEEVRKEERQRADAILQQAEAEKSELLQAEKVATAQKMIEGGFSVEMIERYSGLSAEEIEQLL